MRRALNRALEHVMLALALLVACQARAGEAEWREHMDAGMSAFRAGDYRTATTRLEAALQEAESLGAGDPRLVGTLSDVAYLYRNQGRFAEAEPLYRRALGLVEKALGPHHALVSTRLNELAVLYLDQDRFAEAEPLLRRALEIREMVLGPDHADVGLSLNNLASMLQAQGRNAEAELLYERSLKIAEKALGRDHPLVATALNNLAGLYQAQGRFAEAEPLFRRSLALREAKLGPDHLDIGGALNNLASLHNAQGRFGEAEPLLRRALGVYEKTLGPNHPLVATVLGNLAGVYRKQGRYAEAESLYQRDLAIAEKTLGPDHRQVGTVLNNLALLYDEQGRYREAEPLLRRALGIYEKALGPDHPLVATALGNLAELYRAQGRYLESELLYRRDLEISEKALGPDHPSLGMVLNNLAVLYVMQGRYAEAEPLHRRSMAIREKALGSDHPDVATGLGNLAELYRAQGRYSDAEPLVRRSLGILEKALGSDHPLVAMTLNNLAGFCEAQGRFLEAEPLFQRSLAMREKALGPDHPDVGQSLNNLALLYKTQGRYAEAEPLLRRDLVIREKAWGPDHPDVATTLNNLALLYVAQTRYAEAEPLYLRSLGIREKALGPDHPDVVQSLNNLSFPYRVQGRVDEALALARRASALLTRRFTTASGSSLRGALGEQRTHSGGFEFHVSLLDAVAERGPPARAEAAKEGFGIAQFARASDTAEQVAKMAARYAAGNDALAQLARARQDAMARLEHLDSRIVQAAGQRGAEMLAGKLRAEEAETMKAIAELDIRLERDYPQYRELTNPRPLELAAAQKLLAEDEALVLLLVSADESFLWALRRGEAGFFKLALKRSELVGIVKKLRAQLDLGAGEPGRILARPFDVAAAHDLYRKIFGPAEPLLVGARQLIFVPDGAMQSLPAGVLVTEPPAKPIVTLTDHAQIAWLAKKYAITVLPAAGSLRALRQFAKVPTSQEPFSGFGDPVLEGSGDGARRRHIPALYSRGAVADADEVRKLERLPESAGELRAIATALKAPAGSVRLGSAATERAVKEADLTRYRNLAFATHGLMTGEFKGLAEPALVLTPPEKGSELDDGLLTASEISQLKLDADWVVLSACNTAAPDGTPGAEGLSGLARAFFYAGARSLLVSHWSVSSDAAVALTTRMFDESSKGASKAEALRRSMLALMAITDKPHFAHPAFWAPFVVVGEGNAEWKAR